MTGRYRVDLASGGSITIEMEADVVPSLVRTWQAKFPEVGPMERRPFDPDGARDAAAAALYTSTD